MIATDEQQFDAAIREFVDLSLHVGDDWYLQQDNLGRVYAVKKQYRPDVEFHIVFHPSYAQPVLFFTALCGPAGPSADAAVSQQDHPYLHLPYYFVHPCRTADLMNAVGPCADTDDTGARDIVRWLSFVGPAAGLVMPAKAWSRAFAPA
ncbi:E2-like conjugating enzyme atg10 [Sorochytrium milnesiophthora]